MIVSQIDRISGFITQLLAQARRSEPHLRVVHLHDIVRRVWEAVSDRDAAANVEVVLELAEGCRRSWVTRNNCNRSSSI